jgi:hypothetical protein
VYLFAYFTAESEALHLALSESGHEFSALAGAAAVLQSSVGARSMRDPFIGRDPSGGFHLLATDGWTSDSIVYSHSADLLQWTAPRLVPVMAGIDGARNSWAPEWFVQPDGTFRVIWSSVCDSETVGAVDFSDLRRPQMIWSAVTRDFVQFGPSEPFYAPGFSVIDASVHRVGDEYLLCVKDEREARDDGLPTKNLHVVSWDVATGTFGELRGPISPPRVEGPTWLRRGDDLVVAYDYFMDGGYGASRSSDGRTWSESTIEMPEGARHGAVLEIDAGEAERLLRVFGGLS